MTTLDVESVRIRTDEYDRITEIGSFDGRHIDLLEGMLYEMPPMRTPHLIVSSGSSRCSPRSTPTGVGWSRSTFGYRTLMSPSPTSRCWVSRLAATSPRRQSAC